MQLTGGQREQESRFLKGFDLVADPYLEGEHVSFLECDWLCIGANLQATLDNLHTQWAFRLM
jgi:hypothetical protein